MRVPKLLVVVRHAKSRINTELAGPHLTESAIQRIGRIPDHLDPLVANGHEQGRKTGPYLRETFGTFDAIYVSPYRRTVETLDDILQAYTPAEIAKMRIKKNHLLRERERGYTFTMSDVEVRTAFPWHQSHYDQVGYFNFRSPGGQSYNDMVSQMLLFQLTELDKWEDKKVALITHGGSIRALRYNLEDWSAEDLIQSKKTGETRNCGITVYCKEDGELKLQSYDTVVW